MSMSESVRSCWETRLSGFWSSGLSLRQYSLLHHLSYRAACRWRLRLRPSSAESPLDFVCISSPLPSDSAASPSGIILETGRLHVHLDRGFDRDTLVRVLDILEVR